MRSYCSGGCKSAGVNACAGLLHQSLLSSQTEFSAAFTGQSPIETFGQRVERCGHGITFLQADFERKSAAQHSGGRDASKRPLEKHRTNTPGYENLRSLPLGKASNSSRL